MLNPPARRIKGQPLVRRPEPHTCIVCAFIYQDDFEKCPGCGHGRLDPMPQPVAVVADPGEPIVLTDEMANAAMEAASAEALAQVNIPPSTIAQAVADLVAPTLVPTSDNIVVEPVAPSLADMGKKKKRTKRK